MGKPGMYLENLEHDGMRLGLDEDRFGRRDAAGTGQTVVQCDLGLGQRRHLKRADREGFKGGREQSESMRGIAASRTASA